MEILKRPGTLGLLLLATACDPTRPPTPIDPGGEQIAVGSVLEAGSDTVFVSLVRVTPRLYSRESTAQQIPGAEVRIEGEGVKAHLTEAPPGFPPCLAYHSGDIDVAKIPCYAAVLPGGVRAGGQYQLSIRLPGGEFIEGAATVPRPPTIIAPGEGARWVQRATGDVDSLKVQWTAAVGTAGIGISLQSNRVFYKGAQVADAACTVYVRSRTQLGFFRVVDTSLTDSASLAYELFNCTGRAGTDTPIPFRPDSIHASLLVTAYDTAFTRYLERPSGRSVREEHVTAGITGSIGIFAGVASAERGVTLVPGP